MSSPEKKTTGYNREDKWVYVTFYQELWDDAKG